MTIPRGRGETVLVVAGDSDLRGLAAGLLDALGYRALEAEDAPSALQVLKEAAHVDLLITDVVFAHAMTAGDLAREPGPFSRTWRCCTPPVIPTRPSDRWSGLRTARN